MSRCVQSDTHYRATGLQWRDSERYDPRVVEEWRVVGSGKLGEFVCVSKDCANPFKFSASWDSVTLELIYQYRHIPLPYEGPVGAICLVSCASAKEAHTAHKTAWPAPASALEFPVYS
jgi:hypothetical protein